jgi:hypothetical protein
MRTLILAAALVGAASIMTTTDAEAQGAWCSEYSRGGGTNCGFYTFEQCLMNISGIGGRCYPSPWVAGPAYGPGYSDGPRRVRRSKKRPRY